MWVAEDTKTFYSPNFILNAFPPLLWQQMFAKIYFGIFKIYSMPFYCPVYSLGRKNIVPLMLVIRTQFQIIDTCRC